MKALNYHHLYYFREIANQGSIAKAAEKLQLGQPTLSTQLKQFEESIGYDLFERRNRSLVLTKVGRVALDYANEIFKLGEQMVQVISDKTFAHSIVVNVGADESVPKTLVSSLTRAALASMSCSVTILEGATESLYRDLFAHKIDLILSTQSPMIEEGDRVRSKRLAHLPISFYGSSRFQGLQDDFPKSLEGQPLVVPHLQTKLRQDLDHYFKMNKINPNIVIETDDTAILKLLGSEGAGLISVVDFAVRELVAQKRLMKIGSLPEIHEQFWLIAPNRKVENPVVLKLMKDFEINPTMVA